MFEIAQPAHASSSVGAAADTPYQRVISDSDYEYDAESDSEYPAESVPESMRREQDDFDRRRRLQREFIAGVDRRRVDAAHYGDC
jgi:hypothetical protein